MSAAEFTATLERATKAAQDALDALGSLLEAHRQAQVATARFRESSSARLVAEILLASPGEWMTRTALAAAAGIDPSGVTKAVDRLAESGVPIERHVSRGRQGSRYRVVCDD